MDLGEILMLKTLPVRAKKEMRNMLSDTEGQGVPVA